MDEVPELFVDAVIGLFSQYNLEIIVHFDDSTWSHIGKLHIANRKYFNVEMGKVDGEFAFAFTEMGPYGGVIRRRVKPSEMQLLKPQYLRIRVICGILGSLRRFRDKGFWDEDLLRVGEDQIETFLSQFPNYFAKGNSHNIHLVRKASYMSDDDDGLLSLKEFSDFSRLILKTFYKRVYFNFVTIPYVGSESDDFLKDYIYNHPSQLFLDIEEDWPPSILEDVQNSFRKGTIGSIRLPATFHISREFIMEPFELWKRDGEFQCMLSWESQVQSLPFLEAMTACCTAKNRFYLKHEMHKSMAIYRISDRGFSLTFVKCTCNVSKYCRTCMDGKTLCGVKF